ncbi:MAG: hypothetical protein WC683_17415 [bacterium]|jgi:uncharacterized membrane protein
MSRNLIIGSVAVVGVLAIAAGAGYLAYRTVKKDAEDTMLKAAAENSDDLGRGIGSGAIDALFRNARVMLSGGDGEGTIVSPAEGEI